MLLFYIRHGDPIYEPDSLTPLGMRQAEAVAKRLALYGIDSIYSSTSNRAILTATPTSELVKKEITALEFCHENNVAKYFFIKNKEGKNTWCFQDYDMCSFLASKEISELGDKWYEHPDLKECNFREGCKVLKKDCDEFLLSLGFKHNDNSTYSLIKPNNSRVALFAHEGFGKFFLSNLLDVPYPMFCSHFELNHSGMTVIHFDETKEKIIPKLLTISNDSHLYKEGLSTKYNYSLLF